MGTLSSKEKELVAIGAALASNCVPCIIYHVKQARSCGITDDLIKEAVDIADKVRKVPAEKVFQAPFKNREQIFY